MILLAIYCIIYLYRSNQVKSNLLTARSFTQAQLKRAQISC